MLLAVGDYRNESPWANEQGIVCPTTSTISFPPYYISYTDNTKITTRKRGVGILGKAVIQEYKRYLYLENKN